MGPTPPAATREPSRADRGQSEVLAVVVLLAVVLAGVLVVAGLGLPAVAETRETAGTTAAERAFVALDGELSAVAHGDAATGRTTLGLTAAPGDLRYRDSGWLRVVVDNETGPPETVANVSLGTVEYRQGTTRVAAQGGGVWRRDGEAAVLRSPPELSYRGETLTLPVVTVDGPQALTDTVRLTRTGPPTRRYPNATAGWTNPPDSGAITVTVHSEYYEAWGRYLEAETDALVRYDHASERVTATFVTLPRRDGFAAGVIATAGTGELRLAGTGAYLDSYNASAGDYATTQSADGRVLVAGDFVATGNALVDGNVRSGGTVDLDGSSTVNGSVYWTASPAPGPTHVTGSRSRIDGVRSVPPVDTFVDTYAESVRTTNDNADTAVVDDDRVAVTGGSAELGAGRYYVHNVTVDSGSLTLNTTGGDVVLAVRDYVKLTNDGTVSVVGNGTVHVVVQSRADTVVSPTGLGSRAVNLHVGKGAAVDVPGEVSRQVRVYGTRTFNMTVAGSNGAGNGASFDGIVYAPAGETGTGYVYVKQADLYGLVVTGDLTLGQYGAVHYDYGLRGRAEIRPPYSELDRVYVTVHRVRIGP